MEQCPRRATTVERTAAAPDGPRADRSISGGRVRGSAHPAEPWRRSVEQGGTLARRSRCSPLDPRQSFPPLFSRLRSKVAFWGVFRWKGRRRGARSLLLLAAATLFVAPGVVGRAVVP